MLDGLDAIAWEKLEHAYGTAEDFPGQLRGFLDVDRRGHLVWTWYGNLYHQGTRYPASPVAMPFLAELAERADGPYREVLLRLLVSLLTGFPEEYTLTGFDPDREAEDWGDEADLLFALVEAFEQAVPTFRRLLGDPLPEVREAAAYALAWHRRDTTPTVETLRECLISETSPAVRFSALLALSRLGAAAPLRDALLGSEADTGTGVRQADLLAAAIGLAILDPASCPTTAVPVLLDAASGRLDLEVEVGVSSWHDNDLTDLAGEALALLGEPVRAAALAATVARIPGLTSGHDGLRAASCVLELAFGEPDQTRRPAKKLTVEQRHTLEVLAHSEPVWLFENVTGVFAGYGLPSSREQLCKYLGLDHRPDPEAKLRLLSAAGFPVSVLLTGDSDGGQTGRADGLDPSVQPGSTAAAG